MHADDEKTINQQFKTINQQAGDEEVPDRNHVLQSQSCFLICLFTGNIFPPVPPRLGILGSTEEAKHDSAVEGEDGGEDDVRHQDEEQVQETELVILLVEESMD